MKKLNAIRLSAILALSALILCSFFGLGAKTTAIGQSTNDLASTVQKNLESSPPPTKIRILGAAIFCFAILITIIVIAREIKLSQPSKQKILSKYYRT